MKANYTTPHFGARLSHVIFGGAMLFLFLLSGITSKVSAQCTGTPSDTADFTGHPDTSFTFTGVSRGGSCCNGSSSNCSQFVITLDATTAAVQVSISGASAGGSFTEQADCGTVYNGSGNTVCVNGAGVHYLSICKPGGNTYDVTLTAVPSPSFPPNDLVRVGCSKPIVVLGIDPSTITWQSIFPGTAGDYNSYLSCTSNCDTAIFTPQSAAPAYIDYQICGTATASLCVQNPNVCDTVRIYIYPALSVAINPNPASFCSSSATILTAVVNGGFGSYSYSWTNGGAVVGTSSTYSATSAGTYTLFVNDQLPAGCTDSATVNVTVSNLSLSTSQTNVACNGDNSGTATVSASNGIVPYSYLWSDNETASSISGLSADTYSVTVSDNGGCSAVTSVTITESSSLSATSSAGSIACNGGITTVTVSASGGLSPYNGTGTFTVDAGDYQFTVTDANGCTSRTTGSVSQPSALSAFSGAGAISCNGGTTTVNVTASGGTSPYNGTGAFTVSAGSYSYTVTDANGCTATTTGNVTQPTTLSASSSTGRISCNGGATTVNVTATGGTAPYNGTGSFTVNAGGYTYVVTDANGCMATTSGNVSEPTTLSASSTMGSIACHGSTTTVNVSGAGGTTPYSGTGSFTVHAGSYSYTVTDADGCTATASGNVTEPSTLSASSTAGTIACHGGTATVNVTASGGTPSYNGTGTFTVNAGAYSYTVTDANGCTATTSENITQPTTLSASSSTGTISCNGGSTTVTVTASGGTSPYHGTGGFTRSTGSYSFTVTDANGCTAVTSIVVTQPSTISASCGETDVTCFSAGTATVTAAGGTPSYSYLWNNGRTTSSITGLTTGTFSVTVTDTRGCKAFCSTTVLQPNPLVIAASNTGPVCAGGTICLSVSITGGTGTNTYVWAGPNHYSSTNPSPCIANVTTAGGGTYTVTVNSGICSKTTTTAAIVYGKPTITFNYPNPVICQNTTVQLCAQGGLSYLWSTGATSACINIISAGTYSVTGTDSHGCTNIASAPAISVHCEEHCAYGQGFYGNHGKDCAQQTAPQLIATLLPPDLLLGDSGVSRSIVFLAGDASCVTAKLPAGGPPAELPAGNVSCATATSTHYLNNGRFHDVFVGQTLTLGLNLRLDTALGSVAMTGPYMTTYGVSQCVNGTLVQNTKQVTAIPQNVLTYLGANNTIADLFAFANKALAGIYSPVNHSGQPTISDINDAEDAINEAYDGCRMLVGFTTTSAGLIVLKQPPVVAGNVVMAKAYPNPFNSTTTIEFTLPESSSLASVEVYNLTGAKVATLFHGYAEEGVTYKAEFNGENYANGIYLYRITTDDAYYIDKLILIK